jgi:hypothetical protein
VGLLIAQAKDFGKTILTGLVTWITVKVGEELAILAASAAASAGLSEIVDIARRIYKALVTAKRWARRLLDMANETLDDVLDIASGAVEKVGVKFEGILHRGMPVVIGFLADQVGLGGVGEKISKLVGKLRENVDAGILWVIDRVKGAIEAVIGAIKAGVAAVVDWWKTRKNFVANDKQEHELLFKGSGRWAILMLASGQPKNLSERIQSRLNTLKRKQPKPTDAIDALIRANDKVQSMYEYIAAQEAKTARMPKGADTEAIRDEIEKRLDTIYPLLVTGTIIDSADTLPLTNITYQMKGNKAGTVIADPLTKNPGNTVGRPAPGSPASPPGWKLAQLWNATKTALIFNRVHLVHYAFHGPATEWNLSPAEIQVNVNFQTVFENDVKTRLPTQEMKLCVTALYPNDDTRITFTRDDEVIAEARASDFPSGFTVTLQARNPQTGEFEYICNNASFGGTRPPTSGSLDDQSITVSRVKASIERYINGIRVKQNIQTWSQYRDSSINFDLRKRLGPENLDEIQRFYEARVQEKWG